MRRIPCLVAILAMMMLPQPAFSDDAYDLGRMRLSLIDGDVQVAIRDTTDWTAATINVPLGDGDRLWVPDYAKAEVQMRGGVFVRASDSTALDILTTTEDAAQFYLDRGHLYINNLR